MGYISQVTIAINKKCLKQNKSILQHLEHFEIYQNKQNYYFTHDYIKFHDKYDFVQAIKQFLDEHTDDAAMICIGEDPTDVEFYNSPYNFDLYVNTSIVKAAPCKEIKFNNLKLLFGK